MDMVRQKQQFIQSIRKILKDDCEGEGFVPIGRPVDNTKLYVLNQKLMPVPIGIPGELYIGGDCVSTGYLNLEEMTKERFIPDPFNNDLRARIYKTGDLVHYFPDGNLMYLSRTDLQVKIRGFRIELGEMNLPFPSSMELKKTQSLRVQMNKVKKRWLHIVLLIKLQA